MRFRLKILIVGLLGFCHLAVALAEEDRIWIDAKVNGKPARFVFDSGSPELLTLFRPGAERLGLSITNFAEGRNAYTCEYKLRIGEDEVATWSWVLDLPPVVAPAISADGVIGWPAVTNTVVMIDARARTIDRGAQAPSDTSGWIQLPIDKGSSYLRLLFPRAGGEKGAIAIDTGSKAGILLNPDSWKRWKLSHKNWPMTLRTAFMFGSGIKTVEETCAKEISFGPLTVTDVPISETFPTDVEIGGENYEATFGMGVLNRLDFIVDAIHGVAYLRPRKEKPPRYTYNRAAATFLPRDPDADPAGQEFVAHVMKDGPAYAAGMRDGDVVLKINGQEIKSWTECVKMGEKVKDLPAGEKLSLTLKRGKHVFKATIPLRDFTVP